MADLPEGWEDVPCFLCGKGGGHVVVRARDLNYGAGGETFSLVRCPSCGLVFVNPRPARDRIGRFYPSSYGPHADSDSPETGKSGRVSRRFRSLGDRAPGRYLDVGCGRGGSLLRMKSRGWQVAGFEVSEQAAGHGRAAGLDIRTGRELADARFEAGSFDIVSLFCVLPHLHDPQAVLREVARVLRPGGTLLMTMPNLRSLNFALFRGWWYHLEPPRHLYFFSPDTLRTLAARTGFVPAGREFRSGGGGFRNSLALLGRESPAARSLEGVFGWRPLRWLVRFLSRYGIDPARLGDTVDWWWTKA
jgi:SAM-dependent methyltransferase